MSNERGVAEAVRDALISPNESDRNLESANVVDGLFEVSRAVRHVAIAITPNASPGTSPDGGHVESLTEAVMSVASGLYKIADSLSEIAAAMTGAKEE